MPKVASDRTRKIAIAFACVGIALGIGVWASARILTPEISTQESEPRIVNRTKALQIVGTTKLLMGQEYVLRVTLKNVSGEKIVSYTYLAGIAGNTRSYAFSEKLFEAGDVSEEFIPYENLATTAVPSSRGPDLVFAAVWFEGGAGDGDPGFVRQLSEESEGIREQAGRILPLIRKALKGYERREDQVLTDLESEISLLSTEDETISQSIDYRQGRSMANRQLALKVKELRNNKNNTSGIHRKAEVTGNLTLWERLLTRL
jgi:hypothetical protein